MEKIVKRFKSLWQAVTYPDGLDEEYDCQCDDAFLRFLDKIVIFSWAFYGIVASISIYFLITRELI